MMTAGFAYSGLATIALYRKALGAPRFSGPDATIDAEVSALDAASAGEIRLAIDRAGWPREADVSLVDEGSGRWSSEDITRAHFAMGYLLYPRRIWVRSAADAEIAASQSGQRYVIAIGGGNAFPHAPSHRVTRLLRLVVLP